MTNMRLTIQRGSVVYEPLVLEGVKIEWERVGMPGKLTFTTIKHGDLNFREGDPVCFYYNGVSLFKGYVFTKKRDREHHIQVTCYDQIRYLKNKYTYMFENQTASQIIQALCKDFNLVTGSMDSTKYVIQRLYEENISAIDIATAALEKTLLNTGNMFVLYDDFGKLTVKNVANMKSTTLIYEDSAENFDYSSSIDSETYNSVVLYYKNKDNSMKVFNAYSPSKITEWGTLRYFEQVENPSDGKNKANNLLNLYCRKTRELKIKGAFGDTSVRAGTLIPIKLNLGDIITCNYMLVDKVTHVFDHDHYYMDLTVSGAWEEDDYTVGYQEAGEVKESTENSNTTDIAATSATTLAGSSGNAKADYVMKELIANGASVAGACGVLANIQAESNFNTQPNTGDGGKASGICQWHPDRWANLVKHCQSKGLSPTSIEGQTSFLISELKQYPNVWTAVRTGSGKQGARDAAYLMCTQFERPANATSKGKQRETYGDKWWGIYGTGGRSGSF